MPRPPDRVWRFVLRLLGWSVPCFAAWYALSPWYDRAPAWLAEVAVGALRDDLAAGVEFHGRLFDMVTALPMSSASGAIGVAVVEINPLVSTYGAALFAALALASGARPRTLLAGFALLLPFHAWSIAFDFLAQLVRIGPEAALHAGLGGWRSDLVAFGYQLGSLIAPVLAPVAAWVALEKRYLVELTSNVSPAPRLHAQPLPGPP